MADPEEPLRIRAPAKVQRGQEGDGEQWELRDVRLEPGTPHLSMLERCIHAA